MTDATSGQGEQGGKVYETAAVPARFKSDAWNHFGLFGQEMRNEIGGKPNHRQKTICRLCL